MLIFFGFMYPIYPIISSFKGIGYLSILYKSLLGKDLYRGISDIRFYPVFSYLLIYIFSYFPFLLSYLQYYRENRIEWDRMI